MTEYNLTSEGSYVHFSQLSELCYVGEGVWIGKMDGRNVTVDEDAALEVLDRAEIIEELSETLELNDFSSDDTLIACEATRNVKRGAK